jgi:hypothetical protein
MCLLRWFCHHTEFLISLRGARDRLSDEVFDFNAEGLIVKSGSALRKLIFNKRVQFHAGND